MSQTDSFTNDNIKDLLLRLGYKKAEIPHIQGELDKLFQEINFDKIKQSVESTLEKKDASSLIETFKDLISSLEDKGYYRPDSPAPLIRLLVTGLDHNSENIFLDLIKSGLPRIERDGHIELLASCAAINQLGYILLSCLVPEVKTATAGPHVFLLTEGFSQGSMIFVDFSIDSVKEIDVKRLYEVKENRYNLKKELTGLDRETLELVTEYYSFFHVTSDIGSSHNIHNNLGITYDRLERYQEAIEEFQKALKLDPDYLEVWNNLAVTFYNMGKLEDALKLLQKAIKLYPDSAEAHNNLGNLYAHAGKLDEAIKEFKEAIKINPGFARARNNLGNIYAEQKKSEEAIKEFKEAIRLDPNNALAHSNLGNIYAELGRYKEAVIEFENALEVNPELTEAHHGLGLAYYELGNFNRAAHALINAVQREPGLMESVPEKISLKVRIGVSRLKRFQG